MKKLQVDSLTVESFATTAPTSRERGTVLGRQRAGTLAWCPVSYGGTCIISGCAGCDTDDC